jgi:VWFA-related protein
VKPRYFLPCLFLALTGVALAEGGDGAAQIAAIQATPPATSGATGKRVLDDATIERLLALSEPEQVSVRTVLVPAAVEDRQGRIVRGLTQKDFQVFENQVLQKIEAFWIEGAEPVSIAFLLDVSGSMRMSGKLEAAKEAIRFFVTSLRPQDRYALICFADDQVAWVTDFTSDRARFLERLGVQEGFGQTALNDAVAAAPKLVDERAEGRRAILLFTDGVDNASKLSVEQSIIAARKVEVPIYTVGFTGIAADLREKSRVPENTAVLKRFSEETGGALFVVHDPDELKESVARIDQELRYQYLLAYQPATGSWDGSFRAIRVEARGGRLQVRTRKGYYANP